MAIQGNFPAIRPSLLLDFANSKRLDPRVTFARASTATFYDGSTVAKAEENLLLRSQDYSATWVATDLTPVTGKTAPDGTSTATEFTASGANGTLTQSVTAVAGDYTFSVFLRRVTGTGDVDISAFSGATWQTMTLTADWQRFAVTTSASAGTRTPGIRIVTSGDAIEVWGAQFEFRNAKTAYTPTTTQTITNYVPALRTAAAGVPRFDHNPITGESLGLLIEEQRQNLFERSEEFDNAYWTKTRLNTTGTPPWVNVTVAPDGTLTADKMIPNTDNLTHNITRTGLASGAYTFSVYAKAAEETQLSLWLRGNSVRAVFDLSAGTVSSITVTAASIVPVGNGWYRCSVYDSTAGTTASIFSRIGGSFAGDGYSGLYLWGAQLEAGAFSTSYIPTVGSAVTRQAELASMTGANLSSWYRDDEGTVYADAAFNAPASLSTNQFLFEFDGGSVANRFSLRRASGTIRSTMDSLASTQVNSTLAGAVSTARAAFAYRVDDFATVRDGGTVVADTSGVLPLLITRLHIGTFISLTQQTNGTIRKFAFYPARLTNAQLQAITG